MKRPKIPKDVELQVILRSARRCAMCYALQSDSGIHDGQISHIDHKPTNNDPENLVFLCLSHHNDYDTKKSQAKNYSLDEVKRYRDTLDQYVTRDLPLTWPTGKPEVSTMKKTMMSKAVSKVSLAVFDRRLPIYLVTEKFLVQIVRAGQASWNELLEFGRDTDLALFLFCPEMADYLKNIYTKAVDLSACKARIPSAMRQEPKDEYLRLRNEERELIDWLAHQLEAMRTQFAKYMTLKDD